jgi:hypothetical protein
MIERDRATFSVQWSGSDPKTIGATLGIEPTEVHFEGAPLSSGHQRPNNIWSVNVAAMERTEEDQTGTAALRELLRRLEPAVGKLQNLPVDCHARIWWSADSDSGQGGFVLPAELLRAIADLGVDVYTTVFLSSDDENP